MHTPRTMAAPAAWALAAAVGFAVSCQLSSAVTKDCGGSETHSTMEGEECACKEGFDWCYPDSEDDFRCCPVRACRGCPPRAPSG